MNKTVFRLQGDIDLATAPAAALEIKALLVANPGCDLVVDCSELSFIDSSGIALLVDLEHELSAQGRQLRVIHVPPIAKRAFEICGLDSLLVSS